MAGNDFVQERIRPDIHSTRFNCVWRMPLGNPSGLTAMVYDAATEAGASPSRQPVSERERFFGARGSGIYTFSPASTLTLLPHRYLHDIVLTAETPIAVGAYEWSFASTSSYNPSGGLVLKMNPFVWTSGNGSLVEWESAGVYAQLAVSATPRPRALDTWFARPRRLAPRPAPLGSHSLR